MRSASPTAEAINYLMLEAADGRAAEATDETRGVIVFVVSEMSSGVNLP
jgi:hypothetical protein